MLYVYRRILQYFYSYILRKPLVYYTGNVIKYHSDKASGIDLSAKLETSLFQGIGANQSHLFNTGIKIMFPPLYEGVIRPRSSMSKNNLQVAIGTIDNDYRGELKINIFNANPMTKFIVSDDRIAQLVIQRIKKAKLKRVDFIPANTSRGEQGFGSTNKV